jgi:hypothetical protein
MDGLLVEQSRWAKVLVPFLQTRSYGGYRRIAGAKIDYGARTKK